MAPSPHLLHTPLPPPCLPSPSPPPPLRAPPLSSPLKTPPTLLLPARPRNAPFPCLSSPPHSYAFLASNQSTSAPQPSPPFDPLAASLPNAPKIAFQDSTLRSPERKIDAQMTSQNAHLPAAIWHPAYFPFEELMSWWGQSSWNVSAGLDFLVKILHWRKLLAPLELQCVKKFHEAIISWVSSVQGLLAEAPVQSNFVAWIACIGIVSSIMTTSLESQALVLPSTRKLQSDEQATVQLFRENTPSVVYITNLASRNPVYHAWTECIEGKYHFFKVELQSG